MSLLKGTVRSYDAGTGTAEVEIVGSHGQYATVPVATDLDGKSVVAGKKCAVLSFDDRDSGDAVLVATYDGLFLLGSAVLDDHDHTGDTGDGGQLEADEALLSTDITDGYVFTAVGDDSCAWESRLTYTPGNWTSTDWNGDAKAGDTDAIIDLSVAFGLPAGIAAISAALWIQDETVGVRGELRKLEVGTGLYQGIRCYTAVANQYVCAAGIIPCDDNGDIWWDVSGELDNVWIYISGYWS